LARGEPDYSIQSDTVADSPAGGDHHYRLWALLMREMWRERRLNGQNGFETPFYYVTAVLMREMWRERRLNR